MGLQLRPPLAASSREPLERPRRRELLHRYEPPRVLLPRVLLREQPPLAAPPREPHERHCRREPLHLHEPRVSLPRERHEQAPPELRVPRLHEDGLVQFSSSSTSTHPRVYPNLQFFFRYYPNLHNGRIVNCELVSSMGVHVLFFLVFPPLPLQASPCCLPSLSGLS